MALSAHLSQANQTPRTIAGLRRLGVTALAALGLTFSQASVTQAQQGGCIGYCGNGIAIGIGALAGAAAGVGILVAVNHSHHNLKGCIVDGPEGPQLRTSDAQTYFLEGDPSLLKSGDLVRVHGSRTKKAKQGSVFRVDKVKKDYGPCREAPAPATGAAP